MVQISVAPSTHILGVMHSHPIHCSPPPYHRYWAHARLIVQHYYSPNEKTLTRVASDLLALESSALLRLSVST